MIKNKIKNYILIILGMLILFTILMCITYLIPSNKIRTNINESLSIFKNDYEYVENQKETTKIDIFTDTLILNIALNKKMNSDENILEQVANNSYYRKDTLMYQALKETITNDEYNNNEYSRYWFGLLLIIRPLLVFFNYSEIRTIMSLFLYILIAINIYLMSKELNLKYILAFIVSIAMMNISAICLCIFYMASITVCLISTIIVLLLYKYKKEKYLNKLFLIVGMVTAFFDLLTYPLITFGIPIILCILLENKEGKDWKFLTKKYIGTLCLWIIGYGLSYLGKWIFASIILKENYVSSAIAQVLYRANGGSGIDNKPHYVDNRFKIICTNFSYYFNKTNLIILAIIILVTLCILIKTKKIKFNKIIIPLLLIAILPYIWYFILAEHSMQHPFFTFRIQAITCFAFLSIIFSLENKKE